MFSLFPLLQNFFKMKGGLGPVRDAEVAGAGTHNQKGTKRKDGKIGIIKLHEK